MNYLKNGHKDRFIGYPCFSVAIDFTALQSESPLSLGDVSGKLITIPKVHGLQEYNNHQKLGETVGRWYIIISPPWRPLF